MKELTMKKRILKYMSDFGSITTKDAFVDLGCTRLSEYIRQIREEYLLGERWEVGYNRWGEKTEYKRFWIEYKFDEGEE